ncbi:MAG: S8 family serine peptidase [Stagnimonas sp.]|nr:S8 family serine peptidase [Stagnimonas sp.]
MRVRIILGLVMMAAIAVPAAAQIGLPQVSLPPLGGLGERIGQTIGQTVDVGQRTARELVRQRATRLERLVRLNRDAIELDASGVPARRGELLLVDPAPDALPAVAGAGFAVTGRERIASLDLEVARLALPPGLSLAKAEALLTRLVPDAIVTADQLHFQSGGAVTAMSAAGAGRAAARSPITAPVGVIDGAAGAGQAVAASRGFAQGAPIPSDHGSAMASLLGQAGATRIWIADVYGRDPAGGSALAITRALGWLTGEGVKVISISLVGPQNPLLAKAVAAAQRQGATIVAAVGNDGPAAPPAYPASYPGVIAVTGVDARNRPLIEAGRALHLDYAAPGADMLAAGKSGKWSRVRGTSYAVPLVAARAAAALAIGGNVVARLDREAVDLGASGPDKAFGRGLLCGSCRRTR